MNAHPNRDFAADTQRKGEWSPEEKRLLQQLATRKPRKGELLALFPGRSLACIKIKLYHTRRELGLPKRGMTANLIHAEPGTPMLDPDEEGIDDDWLPRFRCSAEIGNARYLAALQAA